MGCSFTSSLSPQNLGSMEGTRTLNRDNSVLQPQAKGSESDTAPPELFNPQVRSPPPPDHMRGGGGNHLFTVFSFMQAILYYFPPPLPPPITHIRTPQPGSPKLEFPPPVSSIPSPRVHPASANAPPSWNPQTSLQPGSLLGHCRRFWTTPM